MMMDEKKKDLRHEKEGGLESCFFVMQEHMRTSLAVNTGDAGLQKENASKWRKNRASQLGTSQHHSFQAEFIS